MAKAKVVEDHLGNKYESVRARARAYGLDAHTIKERLKKGWSLEQALTTMPVRTKEYKEIEDHLGNKFASLRAMERAYGFGDGVLWNRLQKGMSIEEAITTPAKKNKTEIEDHLGNKFESIRAMADAYGLPYCIVQGRLTHYGWTVEKALTTPVKTTNVVTDHLGNSFESLSVMAKEWGMTGSTLRSRLFQRGWTLEKALTTPVKSANPVIDHLGNSFGSIREMCEFYEITIDTFRRRSIMKNEGKLNYEEVLTEKSLRGRPCVDHLGNTYKAIKDMANAYGITFKLLKARLAHGWSLEKALTTPLYETVYHRCQDHLGTTYPTIRQMCEHWGISTDVFRGRLAYGWSLAEALAIPPNMYIGEYRVAQCLQRLNVKYYHNCSIKTVFDDLGISANWDDVVTELQTALGKMGYQWSKQKIQRLRPDFVLYTDDENKIRGVIEFDGEQHFNFVDLFFKTIEQFLDRSNADMAKNAFWEYMNIPMLRIRHDQIDRIDDMVVHFLDHPQEYIHRHNTYLTEEEYWAGLEEQKARLELAFA